MTMIFTDGFDLYNGIGVNTGLQSKWSIVYNFASAFTLPAGRFGGQCMQVTNNYYGLGRPIGVAQTQCRLSFAFRSPTMPTTGLGAFGHLCLMGGGSTPTFSLSLANNGMLSAYRQTGLTTGTLLGSSPSAAILANTWHWIELEFVCHSTLGRVKVIIDGTPVINTAANQNTNNGVGSFNEVAVIFPSGSGTLQFDDMSMDDTAVAYGSDHKIEPLYPTADVVQGWARSAGTTNFSLVDELLVNGDTDYVQGSLVNDLDTYAFSNLSTAPLSIKAVTLSAFARKTDVTSRSIALQAKSGAATSDGANFALSNSYVKHERVLETDPNTGAAWTGAAVDALTGGPKVTL